MGKRKRKTTQGEKKKKGNITKNENKEFQLSEKLTEIDI